MPPTDDALDPAPPAARADRPRRGRPLGGPGRADGRQVLVRFGGVIGRLPRYLKLGWLLMREPTVPRRGKAALAGALGYAVSPIDPVPGIIPVVGQLDDLAVLLLGIRAALRAAPEEIAEQHLATSGLSRVTLDADLRIVRATAIWIAGRSVATAGRVGKALLGAALRRVPSREL